MSRDPREKCGGLRIHEKPLASGLVWGRCTRCDLHSAYYTNDNFSRCPALRGKLWKPRPWSDNRWDA